MRRKDREVTDFEEILNILRENIVCRIALNDPESGYPYIVPLNYGLAVENGTPVLYFHGATSGRKLDLMKADSRCSFEVDSVVEIVMDDEKGSCTTIYRSVMGRGRLEMVADEGKDEALRILMRHHGRPEFICRKQLQPITAVYRLVVEEMTGKSRNPS